VALLQVVDCGREPPRLHPVSALDRLYLAAYIPTLIVWGEHDRIIPLAHAYQAHEAIPNSRLEVMEGVDHYSYVEEPARFVEILTDFLRTTEPAKFYPDEQRDLLRRGPRNEAVAHEEHACRPPAAIH
jgi:hypothetical protein